ncbi:MAG: rRNA cytosine-C5-methyltransferase [Dysgonamonadaceae bacterium]|nr:rRNA cytosine-C5-methyltransferase [Dysgonamonadaceae bacterium]
MNLPAAFVSSTRALLGDEWTVFERALNDESPVSIRFNPFKKHAMSLPIADNISWATDAFYLSFRPVFTLDPLFHAGCYYVQEASSMFLEYYIKKYVREPVRTLDLCAAPGGKATHLSSILPPGSFLVANEVIRSRVLVLIENIIKWGNPATIVTNANAAELGKMKNCFDLIVCDVPCSGEGMFRKDAASIAQWTFENVLLCAERQRKILTDIFPSLKEGGILIYSTCTYNREENEKNIEWICRQLGAELLETPHRFLPHRTKGEGFFIAGMRKINADSSEITRNMHLPRVVYDGRDLQKVNSALSTPPHALSMSNLLAEDTFPRWELDRQTALQYLHRDVLRDVPGSVSKGFVIVTFQGKPLGFIKNIGSRANNLYPHEWRIRMEIPRL